MHTIPLSGSNPLDRVIPAPLSKQQETVRKLFAEDCLKTLSDDLAVPPSSVDLIYLDPPFNSKSTYNLPFKGKYRNAKPVMAFTDTWEWKEEQSGYHEGLKAGSKQSQLLASIIENVKTLQNISHSRGRKSDLAAYLINMAVRLIKMRNVLKDTGTIYLHCDPYASHYLKMIMDVIFGTKNFRNEIVWCYRGAGYPRMDFGKRHDILFRYSKTENYTFNIDQVRMPYAEATIKRFTHKIGNVRGDKDYGQQELHEKGRCPDDWWEIQPVAPSAKERLGYPTQKPLPLLERIIKASSNEGDVVLDPFCGCGTSIEAAESLRRQWIGIDISSFAVGLIRERVVRNIIRLKNHDIEMHAVPVNVDMARQLAQQDKFEFEKWACGAMGAYGMYHRPGTKGADGGVDGVLDFFPFHYNKAPKKQTAIIQVKGGTVTPDAVRALSQTVRETGSLAGIIVCFQKYMRTVENNRSKDTFRDDMGTYPVIQGFSVEDLFTDRRLNLPQYLRRSEAETPRFF